MQYLIFLLAREHELRHLRPPRQRLLRHQILAGHNGSLLIHCVGGRDSKWGQLQHSVSRLKKRRKFIWSFFGDEELMSIFDTQVDGAARRILICFILRKIWENSFNAKTFLTFVSPRFGLPPPWRRRYERGHTVQHWLPGKERKQQQEQHSLLRPLSLSHRWFPLALRTAPWPTLETASAG